MPENDLETPRERIEDTILKLTAEGATPTVRTINARMRKTFGTGVRTELVTEILAEWQQDEDERRRLPDYTELRWRKVLEDIYRDAGEQADATFRTDRQKLERKIANLEADETAHGEQLDNLTRGRDDALAAKRSAEADQKTLSDKIADQAETIDALKTELKSATEKSGRLEVDLSITEARLEEQPSICEKLRPDTATTDP